MDFIPLSLDIRKKYTDTLLRLHHESASLSFTNLFLLDHENKTEVVIEDDFILVKQYQDKTDTVLLSVVGLCNEERLLSFEGINYIERWSQVDGYTKDIDNAEYVYNINDILSMQGANYASVRRKYQKAKTSISSLTVEQKYIDEDTNFPDLFDQFTRNKIEDTTSNESLSFSKCLMFAEEVGVDALILKNDDDILGFAIIEKIYPNIVTIHFFKHTHSIDGFGVLLFYEVAQHVSSDAIYLNFQQDLGYTGLRQFKNMLRPHHMVTPYIKKL